MKVLCPECGSQETSAPDRWRCPCGGAWEPADRSAFDPARIDIGDGSIWRYRGFLGLALETPTARLGVGWTPLVPLTWDGRRVLFKLEYLAPTSSFKDRGTEAMINLLQHQGVTRVVDDSSGNAGASVAAYAARAGMQAEIFVPAHAAPAKQAQIAVYGAAVHPIPGVRAEAKRAAWQAADRGATLASHAYHPAFLAGQLTVAWEVWEQLGQRAPDWYVVPVGQGVHLLGVWLGFRRLQKAGLVRSLPRLVAVQAAALAPVCQALSADLDRVPPLAPSASSVAEGLAISEPVRGSRILQAIRETGGTCLTVDDDAILGAQRRLAHRGLFVEPTSATAVAALDALVQRVAPHERIVVPLTGSGLKGSPTGAGSSSD
jgi:threonine synthase